MILIVSSPNLGLHASGGTVKYSTKSQWAKLLPQQPAVADVITDHSVYSGQLHSSGSEFDNVSHTICG